LSDKAPDAARGRAGTVDALSLIASPPLPSGLLYVVAALSALIIVIVLFKMKSRAGMFVAGAIWLRNVMSAFPMFSHGAVLAGMSANALASTAVVGVGLFQIRLRNLGLRFLTPFYLLMIVTVISAVVNNSYDALIGVLVKYLYLIVVTLAVYEALAKRPDGRFMRLVLWAFLAPFALQALSLALGIAKQTENDLSVSYIGGYAHEATFSVILATCAVIATLTTRMNRTAKTVLILACIAGIYLANYRTTIIAIAPLLLAYFGFAPVRRVAKRDRPLVVSAMIVFLCIVLGIVGLFLAQRFGDMALAVSGDVNFFKPPYEYSEDESRILSGRPLIWSVFIYGWMEGEGMQQLFGFGPEAWQRLWRTYAHNTLVNTLFEYGVLGVLAVLFCWSSMLAAALRVRHPNKTQLVAAHVSFLVLNMGTMPMWMIEGSALYGVICGYTLYLLAAPQEQQAAARAAQQRSAVVKPFGAGPSGRPTRPAA
jgi:hypothetical protein